METLLEKVKANLILEHDEDDALVEQYLKASLAYAESYQHLPENYYQEHILSATTEQGVIMLTSFFYESRDGSTAGFYQDNVSASGQVWNTVNTLLRIDRRWQV